MNENNFLRLLNKTDLSFDNEIVTAQFENKYYYLNSSFDVPNNKIEIDFQHSEDDSIKLTDDQEETLLKLMYNHYVSNVQEWKQQNKTALQKEAKLSLLSTSDKLKTLRSSTSNS